MGKHDGRRWFWRALMVLVGLGALVASAALVLLHSLDQPWLKRRVQDLARSAGGVDIDYRAVRVALFSGAEVDGLSVRSPVALRASAPELIRVGRVNATWSLPGLLLGRGTLLDQLVVSDVAMTVVVDEHGKTSFDALSTASAPSPPSPSVPLSRQTTQLLGARLPVARLEIDRVTLAVIRTVAGEVFDRAQLHGLSLALQAGSAAVPEHDRRLNAALGSPDHPLELSLSRTPRGAHTNTARAKVWLTADVSASVVRAALDVRMLEQTFVASVAAAPSAPDHWLHAETNIRFDPAAGKTAITLDHTEAGDGAASVDAALELSDAGAVIVRRAHGEVDLARLLRWLPEGLVPVTAEHAQLHFDVDALMAGSNTRLSPSGSAALDVSLSKVALRDPAASLELQTAKLTLRAAQPEGGAITGHGSLAFSGTRLAAAADVVAADGGDCEFDLTQRGDGAIDGNVALRFARFAVEHAAPAARGKSANSSVANARDARIELRVRGLRPDTSDPLATRGDVSLSLTAAELDARMPSAHAMTHTLALHAHSTLEGHAPYAAELDLRAARLRVIDGTGHALADAPAELAVHAREVMYDAARPAASSGTVYAALDLGELRASLDGTKHTDALDYEFTAAAGTLKVVRPFLPSAWLDDAPWDRMGLSLRSRGRVEHLTGVNPALHQSTQLDLARPAFTNIAAARSLSLKLQTQGDALAHQADIDLRTQALAFGSDSPGDDHITLSAKLDRKHPSLSWQFASEGRATTKLTGSLAFDASRRAVAYEVDAQLASVAALAPFAAKLRGAGAFDLSKLEVDLSAHGTLLGVVSSVSRDGTVAFEQDLARSAQIEGATDIRLAHFRWHKGDTAIAAPDLTWHSTVHSAGDRRTLDSRLEIGTLHLGLGSHEFDLNGVHEDGTATLIGMSSEPEIELAQHIAVHAVEQTWFPEYPLGELALALTAERAPDGVVHISELELTNGAAGTALSVSGNVDFAEGRRTLSVNTSLAQDLARLSTIPERLTGRGKLAVEANVTSPDFVHYRVRASVKGEDVNLSLARAGVELEAANGEVPITVALEVGARGVVWERTQNRNPYSMLRFADQLPLLRRSGFLSIGRLKTPFVSIAPLVGNLEIEHNVIALRQFEMGVRGGSITGQCGLDWDGPNSTLELHVRANGVQSSHGEPFDGNIAVAISAADRTIDGRAEILRIGERHLLDLLDLQDPLHTDAAMNRIRGALAFGYPDGMRLVFDHGFASAHLELGGLAKLVSISELRGIPMGPIVDRMLGQMLGGPDLKETP